MTDFQPAPIDDSARNQLNELLQRLARIAPELIRYAWLGQGFHEPLGEHRLLGLTKVQVMWLRVTHDGLETPGWTSGAMQAQVMEQAGATFTYEQKEALARDTAGFTMLKIRYWADGMPGARFVQYKCFVGGGGNDNGGPEG